MSSRLLNSGDLKNYQAIGEDGVLVWQKADSFRSSILTSEHLGEKYSNYLATPRFTADGSHVDWFIPFAPSRKDGEYDVVSWNAATQVEKDKAFAELSELNDKFLNYGYNLKARALTPNDKIFAHFLTGNSEEGVNPAIHFPDSSCVYIVDGHPVITFWGFLKRGAKLSGAPTDVLRTVQRTQSTAAPGPAAATAAAAPVAASHRLCWLWGLLLLLLLPLLLYLLWWWLFARNQPLFSAFPDLSHGSLEPVAIEEEQKEIEPPLVEEKDPLLRVDEDGKIVKVVPGDTTVVPADGTVAAEGTVPVNGVADAESAVPADGTISENTAQDEALPEDPENEVPATDENADNQENTPASEAITPDDKTQADAQTPDAQNQSQDDADSTKDDSQNKTDTDDGAKVVPPDISSDKEGPSLSNQDLSSGNIKNLDGNWKVNTPIFDKLTNKPLQLQYDFKDGKGTATITQKNGVKCVAPVSGGLKGGALNIASGASAKCTDGSSYAMPQVECKPGKDGNSRCVSTYNDGKGNKEAFPMTIHR